MGLEYKKNTGYSLAHDKITVDEVDDEDQKEDKVNTAEVDWKLHITMKRCWNYSLRNRGWKDRSNRPEYSWKTM